ncbi:porin PorA family protein [Pimelobacter simplex]|uniref:porin PorA family protein n=1 Tax=Nocardioides simplex TaxID=2045 RepID=UPI0027DD532A
MVQPPPTPRVLRRPHSRRGRGRSLRSPPDPNNRWSLKLESLRTCRGGSVASDDKAAEGSTGCLAAAFPIGPQAKDVYDLYESATQQCFPVHYTGKSKISGREVFNYSLTASGPLKDPHMLESLPPALPKAALESLAPALSEDVQAQFSGALDALPDPVPLNYVVDKTVDAAVDSETGIPLDETLHQQISVQVDTGADQLTLAPVLVVDASVTDDSVDKLSDKAASAGRLLLAFQTIIPLALLVVGLVLVAFAVRRHRKDGRQS